MIPRGQVHRLARLDLLDRCGAYWCDAEVDSGATTFDGDLWIAVRKREVFAVDTTAARWRAVWGIEVDPADARCSVRRDGDWFVIAARTPGELVHWYYQRFALRSRRPWQGQATDYVAAPAWLNEQPFVVRDGVAEIASVEIARDIAVVNRRAATRVVTTVHNGERLLATLRLDGATTACSRLTDTMLTIGDDRGRVIVLDVERGIVRREARTR
jgi:hypothetical protein